MRIKKKRKKKTPIRTNMTVRMEGSYQRPGQKMDFKKTLIEISLFSVFFFQWLSGKKNAICWKPAFSREEVLWNRSSSEIHFLPLGSKLSLAKTKKNKKFCWEEKFIARSSSAGGRTEKQEEFCHLLAHRWKQRLEKWRKKKSRSGSCSLRTSPSIYSSSIPARFAP